MKGRARARGFDIPLQTGNVLHTLATMRAIFVTLLFCLGAITGIAQVQERKLMDRVLKPDMTLENSAQNKQFVPSGASAPAKRVRPKMFQFLQRSQARDYAGVRKFETRNFQARKAPDEGREANLATRNVVAENGRAYQTATYSGVRTASAAQKSVAASEFHDSGRAFLVRGKSQKALSAQDRPLTIDDVRELLNKNK